MNIHKNARTTPRGREWIAGQAARGQTPKALADAVGVCPRTVRKWVKRHENEGVAGLADRSSRPHRLYRPTPQPAVERIEALRRQRLTGQAIAAEVGVSPATVSPYSELMNDEERLLAGANQGVMAPCRAACASRTAKATHGGKVRKDRSEKPPSRPLPGPKWGLFFATPAATPADFTAWYRYTVCLKMLYLLG